MMKLEEIMKLADSYHDIGSLDWIELADPDSYMFLGKVVPKQRPRKGKGGRMFTPPETREFEKRVADWGRDLGMAPVNYPIRLTIWIYDKTDDTDLIAASLAGAAFHSRKDLDNMHKSITDGLNGVAYNDDGQIVDSRVLRRYARNEGFRLTMSRAGLNKAELKTFMKIVKSRGGFFA